MRLKAMAPWLAWGWKIWAHFWGMAIIALAIGAGIVQAVSGRDAVFTIDEIRYPGGVYSDGAWTLKVPLGGRYQYVYSGQRHESCPGEIVTIFESLNTPTAVITLRKPAVLLEPKLYPDTRIDNPLPATVTPGFWNVGTSLVSHCANREWTDRIATFRIEVTP